MTAEDDRLLTRTAYDVVAVDYARLLQDELAAAPLDRALLGCLAELVQAAGGGPVLDAGCGPGRLSGHLRDLGLAVQGVDLSAGMVAEARRRHPDLNFERASLSALPLRDGELAGVLAWYSVIHTAPRHLPAVFDEFGRVLRPDGHLLLAFQCGAGERVERSSAYGHAVRLVNHRHDVQQVEEQLAAAGFQVQWRLVREPGPREVSRQAYLLARRPPHR